MSVRRMLRRLGRRPAGRSPAAGWPAPTSGGGARVLLEYPSFSSPSVASEVLSRAGYRPLVCEGPGDTTGSCRLLTTGSCPLADEADVIYNAFGLGTEEHREILRTLQERHPRTPIVVETTRPSAERHAELLGSCVRSELPVTGRGMVGAVASVLAAPSRPPGPIELDRVRSGARADDAPDR